MSVALFFGPHPDDIELSSGGLAALLVAEGHRVVLADLTRGEAASRGTVEERAAEAAAAARALGVSGRENLGLPDLGLNRANHAHLGAIVACMRRHRPDLVVAPHRDDPHPDHVEASHLVERACYACGVLRFPAAGDRHRPGLLMLALYRSLESPHVVIDVSRVWERKSEAIRAHRSQLDPEAGPSTYLTDSGFLPEIEGQARVWGVSIGARYGEGYRLRRPFGVVDTRALFPGIAPGARP
jgi:bacillithiol biosynthesis deacetylase BshB1